MPKFRAGCGRCLTRSSGRSRAPCTALAAALRGDVDEESRDAVARRARALRPFSAGGAWLAVLTLLGRGQIVAQSVTQARKLAAAAPNVVGAAQP